jgi:hypothetical protein
MGPASEPYHFWGRTQCGSEFVKIRVGRYNNETALPGKIPDLAIRALLANRTQPHGLIPDTVQIAERQACATGSRRKAASQSNTPAHVGGEVINRGKIVRLEFRVVVQDFLLGHSRCEPTQHVPNGDAEPAHTRLTGPFSGLDADSSSHDPRIASAGLVAVRGNSFVRSTDATAMAFSKITPARSAVIGDQRGPAARSPNRMAVSALFSI